MPAILADWLVGTSAPPGYNTKMARGNSLFSLGYRPALDGVRAVAITAVLAYHFHVAFPSSGGFLGVEIFFVLSGFLITSVLLQERARRGVFSLRAFYMRRALRLFPALALVSVAVVAYALIDRPRLMSFDLREVAAAIGYSDNWYQIIARPPQTLMGHTWSLSVEEQFYILWPFALLLALRRNTKAALTVALFFIAASAIARAVQALAGASDRAVTFSLHGRLDALLIGCALALLCSRGTLSSLKTSRIGKILLGPSVALIVGFLVFAKGGGGTVYGGFTLFSFAVAVVLANLVLWPGRVNTVLELRPIVWIGRLSYSIYLWHQPIYLAALEHFASNTAAVAFTLPATIAASAMSYYWVERPFLRLKSRYERKEPTPSECLPAVEQRVVAAV